MAGAVWDPDPPALAQGAATLGLLACATVVVFPLSLLFSVLAVPAALLGVLQGLMTHRPIRVALYGLALAVLGIALCVAWLTLLVHGGAFDGLG